MKKLLPVLLAALMLAPAINAMTEKEFADAVIAFNPGIAGARAEYKAEQAYISREWFLKNPMVSVEYMGIADTGIDLTAAMEKQLAVSQDIPFPVKPFFRSSVNSLSAEMKRQAYIMKKREILAEAYAAYVKAYVLQEMISISETASANLKQALLAPSGLMQEQGYEAEYALSVNETESLKAEMAGAWQELLACCGNASDLSGTIEAPEVFDITMTAEDYNKAALINSPEIKMAEIKKQMAGGMKTLAILDYVPDLNVTWKKSLNNTSDYSLMFMAELPIWFLNNQQAMIGRESGIYEAQSSGYEDIKNNVLSKVTMMHAKAKNEYRAYVIYRDMIVPKAEAALKAAAVRSRSGAAGISAVIDAQKMLLMAKKDALMRLEKHVMSYRELEAMTKEESGE